MTVPAYARTWHQLLTSSIPGNRIPYVSVTDAAQNTMYQTKAAMVGGLGQTTGFSLLWSASGGTGPTNSSDHTDRWTSSSAITPQATVAAASQAWCVLVGAGKPAWATSTVYAQGAYVTANGNVYVCRTAGTSASSGGGPSGTGTNIADNTAAWQYMQAGTGAPQILITYQGASADIFRLSISPAGLFTLAGTTNNQPTAADEQVFCSATSIVNSATSGDRILHVWCADDASAWKMVVLRAGAMAGPLVGCETIQDGVVQFPVPTGTCVAALPCDWWGFAFSSAYTVPPINSYQVNACGGLMRSLVAGAGFSCQINVGVECIAPGGTVQSPTVQYSYQAELQGASGYLCFPLAIHTTNATGSRGRLGNLIDWYISAPSGVLLGDGYGSSYQWWELGYIILPNPSGNAPTIT